MNPIFFDDKSAPNRLSYGEGKVVPGLQELSITP
jgi:hypothetical protein